MSLPAIILVKPQMGENIGATARVMLNFGFTDLRIIAPRDGWPNPKAEDMSAGAIDVIKNAKIFDNTADALDDITHLYATTARLRDMIKPVYSPRATAEEICKFPSSKAAIMFGAERSGLENEDVVLANAVVTIPVAPIYASLNLAKAVCVLCYEIAVATQGESAIAVQEVEAPLANRREIDDTLLHLEQTLDRTEFFRVPEKKPRMLKNIRNMFTRHDYSEQEIRTFRGMIKAIGEKL